MAIPPMKGRLVVVGLGPGDPALITPDTLAAAADADLVFGYGPYIDRLPEQTGQRRMVTGNGDELARAGAALDAAAAGHRVLVVSGGDPGVFAMAAAVCEAIEAGPPAWREIDVSIKPGITAMLAVAARVGAPLGHDFCVMSLSDNLKPWDVITRRLAAAAGAGFVLALYNPISRARPWQLGAAFDVLRPILPANTPVVFGRALNRPDECVTITDLQAASTIDADMSTCIIVGSPETRIVARGTQKPLVYTLRGTKVRDT
jgi:precorrin-3B C17-methyltransferase